MVIFCLCPRSPRSDRVERKNNSLHLEVVGDLLPIWQKYHQWAPIHLYVKGERKVLCGEGDANNTIVERIEYVEPVVDHVSDAELSGLRRLLFLFADVHDDIRLWNTSLLAESMFPKPTLVALLACFSRRTREQEHVFLAELFHQTLHDIESAGKRLGRDHSAVRGNVFTLGVWHEHAVDVDSDLRLHGYSPLLLGLRILYRMTAIARTSDYTQRSTVVQYCIDTLVQKEDTYDI